MFPSDDPLVERVRQADQEALAEWIDQQRPRLLATIQRGMSDNLASKVEPDDILQEVSADAIRSLPEMDFAQQHPYGWLCELIRRRIVDAHRHHFGAQKRAGDREVRLDASPPGAPQEGRLVNMIIASITSPSAVFSRDQKQLRLAAAIDELPEQQREALRLRYVEGRPTGDVATALGKSHGATRVLLSRTMKQLRDLLGEG